MKLLDVAGPLQVFCDAEEYAPGRGRYESRLLSAQGGPVATDTGVRLDPVPLDSLRPEPRDTLIVPDGNGVYKTSGDAALVTWLGSRAAHAGRVARTCTGAFLLAAAGLLEGRRAVTRWRRCDRLQDWQPSVQVEQDPIFVQDGAVWTSAGVTAGIHLALALVEHDLGRDVALELARNLVVHSKRAGGQSQFSQRLRRQAADTEDKFAELPKWIPNHLQDDLRVERLAERAGMSSRTFQRAFVACTGSTPARAVSAARVEAARELLSETSDPVKTVAHRCGFATEEQMRRTFQRELGLAPSDYRRTWSRHS